MNENHKTSVGPFKTFFPMFHVLDTHTLGHIIKREEEKIMNNKKWKNVKLNQICSINTLRVNRIRVSVVRVKDDEQVYDDR